MAKKARFGTGVGRHLTMHDVAEHAEAAERYGFEHATFLDDIHLTRDVYCMLSVAAMSTSKILLGHGVTHPYTRHPVQTAIGTASINELSNGRAFLGMGAGVLYSMIGMHNGKLDDIRETIRVTRALSHGESFELKNGTKIDAVWTKDPFPVYMGADGPGTMQLAGELADAIWIPGFHPTLLKWRFENIERGAERGKRRREDVDVWLRTMVVMADSKEEGRDIARPYCATIAHAFANAVLARDNEETRKIKSALPESLLEDYATARAAWDYYQHETYGAKHAAAVSDQIVDNNVIVGTPEECAETIQSLLDAGFDGISTTVYLHKDKIGFWRDFHDHVAPLLEA